MLELSAKQKKRLGNWARPSDFASEPQMILAISSFSIKQTVVSDCSFVASIAISAAYERKYRKKLITSIIYPQNKKGEPMYNPCGMTLLFEVIIWLELKISFYFREVHGEAAFEWSFTEGHN